MSPLHWVSPISPRKHLWDDPRTIALPWAKAASVLQLSSAPDEARRLQGSGDCREITNDKLLVYVALHNPCRIHENSGNLDSGAAENF